jgi:hypothetical protein
MALTCQQWVVLNHLDQLLCLATAYLYWLKFPRQLDRTPQPELTGDAQIIYPFRES